MAKTSGSGTGIRGGGRAGKNYYGYSYSMNGAKIYTVDEPGGIRAVYDSKGRVISMDAGRITGKNRR